MLAGVTHGTVLWFVLHLAIGEKTINTLKKIRPSRKLRRAAAVRETCAPGTNQFSSTLHSPSFWVTRGLSERQTPWCWH